MCQITQKLDKKELFEKFYSEHINEKRSVRRKKIIEAMLPYFDDKTATENYVDANMARKKRNLICRRVRMVRKANLADFNYFVTVKYIYGYAPDQLSRLITVLTIDLVSYILN